MPSLSDLRRQVDNLDRQIVELLSRRTTIVKQILAHLAEEEADKEREQQVLSNWLEEGFDYDLDELALEKVCKAVMELGRKSREA
jgi:chorismate mutase